MSDYVGPTEHTLLQAIMEHAHVGLAVFDRDGRFTHVNQRLADWNGASPEAHLGKSPGDLSPDLEQAAGHLLRTALSGHRTQQSRTGSAHGTGGATDVWDMEYFPVRDRGGEVIGAAAIIRQRTAEYQAERRLTEAYAHLEALFDNVPVSLSVWDAALRLVRVNTRMLEWNDLDATTAIGSHLADLFPAIWDSTRSNFFRALAGERVVVQVDRRARGQMTGPAHGEMLYAPVMEAGRVTGVIVASTDVTQRVRNEQALQQAYAQLQAVFDNVPVAIAVYDRDLRILRMNDEMARWNGVDRDTVVGRRAQDVFTAQWHQATEHRNRALMGEACQTEIDRRAAGQVHGPAHVLASYTPVVVDGEVVGLTVSSTDITARVEAAERAEAAIQFRDDLMSIASHELRTPLTSIIGFAERLERIAEQSGDLPLREASEDLSLIRGESQRMARTLDVLLDLVGLAAGAADLEHEPVALAPLVRRQVRMVRERHPQLQIMDEITAEPIVEADGDRIAQVISNLLENAAKYAGESAHVAIRISVAGRRALVQVQDDGPGVPLEEQHTVFSRHYRGRTNGTDGTSGLGLGLYLSRTIAIRLGGTLSLSSTPGQGATFTLALPYEAEG